MQLEEEASKLDSEKEDDGVDDIIRLSPDQTLEPSEETNNIENQRSDPSSSHQNQSEDELLGENNEEDQDNDLDALLNVETFLDSSPNPETSEADESAKDDILFCPESLDEISNEKSSPQEDQNQTNKSDTESDIEIVEEITKDAPKNSSSDKKDESSDDDSGRPMIRMKSDIFETVPDDDDDDEEEEDGETSMEVESESAPVEQVPVKKKRGPRKFKERTEEEIDLDSPRRYPRRQAAVSATNSIKTLQLEQESSKDDEVEYVTTKNVNTQKGPKSVVKNSSSSSSGGPPAGTNLEKAKCFQCQMMGPALFIVRQYGTDVSLCSTICFNKFRYPDPTTRPAPCVKCSNLKRDDSTKTFLWETMNFCSDNCLGAYQIQIGGKCSTCLKKTPWTSLGKYCVRFGSDIRQFCTASCLEAYKKTARVCFHCQVDIKKLGNVVLANIPSKSSPKEFCSQDCVTLYIDQNVRTNKQPVIIPCFSCKYNKPLFRELSSPYIKYKTCSLPCWTKTLEFLKIKSPTKCGSCTKYINMDTISLSPQFYIGLEKKYEGFCSATCKNLFVLKTRKILSCVTCKVKKYNFDLIEHIEKNEVSYTACSLNCLPKSALYLTNLRTRLLSTPLPPVIQRPNLVPLSSPSDSLSSGGGDKNNSIGGVGGGIGGPIIQSAFSIPRIDSISSLQQQNPCVTNSSNNSSSKTTAPHVPEVVYELETEKGLEGGSPLAPTPYPTIISCGDDLYAVYVDNSGKIHTSKVSDLERIQSDLALTDLSLEEVLKQNESKGDSRGKGGGGGGSSSDDGPELTNVEMIEELLNAEPGSECGSLSDFEEVELNDSRWADCDKFILLPPPPSSIERRNKGCSASPLSSSMSTQTDVNELKEMERIQPKVRVILVPVPVLVPFPLYGANVPVPYPFCCPVPIPIPIPIGGDKGGGGGGGGGEGEILSQETDDEFVETEMPLEVEIDEDEEEGGGGGGGGGDKREDDVEMMDMSESDGCNYLKTAPPNFPSSNSPMSIGSPSVPSNLLPSSPSLSTTSKGKAEYGLRAWKLYFNDEREPCSYSNDELCEKLTEMTLKGSSIKGERYSPDSLLYFFIGIQQHLKASNSSISLFYDSPFVPFVETFTSYAEQEMSRGVSICKVDEELMWESGELGLGSPGILLFTLVLLLYREFGLRTWEEHAELRSSQVEVVEDGGRSYVSLSGVSPEVDLIQLESGTMGSRCPVTLLSHYFNKCESREGNFYKAIARSFDDENNEKWYSAETLDQFDLYRMLVRAQMICSSK